MIKFIIGFIGWLGFIRMEVGRNYQLIEVQKQKPDYLHSFFFRAFFGFVFLVLMAPTLDPLTFITWLDAWPALVYELTSFYLLFDPWLNLKRGKEWNYQGDDSGYLDKLPKILYYLLKVLCLIGLAVSVYILFEL